MMVRLKHNGRIVADNILLADSFMGRLVGLMFRKGPPTGSRGLLLVPGNAIHTHFMRYSLDIVFLSHDNRIVKIIRSMKPWRMTRIYFKAFKTLEVPAGEWPLDINEGSTLEVEHV